MAINTTVTLHSGSSHYTERPPISMSLSVSNLTRSGNTISCSVSASVNGLGGESYFGYGFQVYAQLDNGTQHLLFSKPNSPSQWSSGDYSGSATCSSTNTTTSATFKILFRANCTCSEGSNGGDISKATLATVYSQTVSAPAANVTVTFDLDGGTRTGGGALTQSVAIGGSATAPTCTRANCDFAGWSRSLTNITSSVTITAYWDYHIDYVCTGTEYVLARQIKERNVTLKLHDVILDRPGYTFSGWSTSSSATSVQYKPGANYTSNAPATLYAVWGASTETFTVKFDLRGGTYTGGGALTQTVRYGNSATPPNNPTKSGKRFSGWLGDYTNVTSDRTIKALWGSSPLWIFTSDGVWIPFSS